MGTFRVLQPHLVAFAVDCLRLGVWLALLMVLFVPVERLCALHRQKIFRKAFPTDLVYFFLSGLLPKLLLILPMTLIAWVTHRFLPSELYARVAGMPVWMRFAAAMIVGEAGFYWGHRWMHQAPVLWRFHAIHHSAEELDWLVNTRVHPVDLVFTRLCDFLPMYVLGLAQPTGSGVDAVPVVVAVVGTVWGFFVHANVSWRLGWLEWLVTSPAFHHWHHTNDGPDTINKNYASLLPWMDKCFGTFYLPRNQWPGTYGTDAPMASTVTEQLLQPFVQLSGDRRHPPSA